MVTKNHCLQKSLGGGGGGRVNISGPWTICHIDNFCTWVTVCRCPRCRQAWNTFLSLSFWHIPAGTERSTLAQHWFGVWWASRVLLECVFHNCCTRTLLTLLSGYGTGIVSDAMSQQAVLSWLLVFCYHWAKYCILYIWRILINK